MPMRASSRPMKRRRFTRRRFKSKRTTDWTSQSAHGGGIRFKGRRQSKRVYKKNLWIASQAQTHYRSSNAANTNLTTPASANLMAVTLQTTRRFAGSAFFVTAGGAINPDGGAIPTFAANSDITIRGGLYGLRIANTPDGADVDKDSINVHVYLVWTSKNLQTASVPGVSVSVGWDPTLITDFQTDIGKVIYKKSFLVHEGDVFTIERRMGLQKIDQTEYAATKSEPAWIIAYGNASATTAKQLSITTYYNMSFVGDTV